MKIRNKKEKKEVKAEPAFKAPIKNEAPKNVQNTSKTMVAPSPANKAATNKKGGYGNLFG